MKSSVTFKLILAFVVTSLMVAMTMGAAARWSFQRGFLDYVQQVEVERLDSLVRELAVAYAGDGNWEFLRDDRRRWRALLAASRPKTQGDAPAPPGSGPVSREPPPGGMQGTHHPKHKGRWSRPVDPLRIARRLTLLDAEQRFVVGNPRTRPEHIRRPVEHGGAVVGWVSVAPLEILTNELDLRFQEAQSQALLVIGAAAALVAGLVSVFLARQFLAPVKALAQGTRALTAGRFETRIPVGSTDELGQLAGHFNALALTLERTDKARRDLMADVSHELRTPLSVLRGEIEAMVDGVRAFDASGLESLHAEIMTLDKLVSDLYKLSLSDIGALAYRKEPVNVFDLLDAALGVVAERYARREISLHVDQPETEAVVFGDPGRLTQLFGNLLENTLRYTDSGGTLRIRCQLGEDAVSIDLEDSAPGVPEEALGRLFERLYRVEGSRSRASGGAGLGLAICRNIVEAHGGAIAARSSSLGGVGIGIKLPLVKTRRGRDDT